MNEELTSVIRRNRSPTYVVIIFLVCGMITIALGGWFVWIMYLANNYTFIGLGIALLLGGVGFINHAIDRMTMNRVMREVSNAAGQP